MSNYIFISIMILYLFISVMNIIRVIIVKKWMNIEMKNANTKCTYSSKKLYLLVPLYNEQNIISQTYKHFWEIVSSFENVYAVFITTNKETSEITTEKLLSELINQTPSDKIIHIHYPYKKGVMAHQLNYAIEYLNNKNTDNDDFWLGIYNADSRIDGKTIKYILHKIENIPEKSCFQQYSWYKNPIEKKKSTVGSASLWQTRWSLCFELYRVLYQLFLTRHIKSLAYNIFAERMNYVIGHGFYISNKNLKILNGFPEDSINEDAFLGLKINCDKIVIYPIPYLEEADFASSISTYIKQQTVWFNGPLYAFSYCKKILAECRNGLKEKSRYVFLSAKLFLHAIYWLFGPIALYFIPIICITNITQLLVWLLVILIELPITHYYIRRTLLDMNISDEDVAKPSLIYCLIFYFVHCMGPIRGLFLKLIGRNTQEDKYKTER